MQNTLPSKVSENKTGINSPKVLNQIETRFPAPIRTIIPCLITQSPLPVITPKSESATSSREKKGRGPQSHACKDAKTKSEVHICIPPFVPAFQACTGKSKWGKTRSIAVENKTNSHN
jgi:hypothetical protein